MKRKIIILLLATILLICTAVGLAACNKTCEHDYTLIEYNWTGNDYCEAVRTCEKCSADEEGHDEKAVAMVTPLVTQNKTCELPELTTYTATFTETWAETQTKENVETASALGHEYAETGTTDETGHWHACTHENCGNQSTYAEIDKNNDYACDICDENLLVKLKADLAVLVGDDSMDSVTVTLNLAKNADADFAVIKNGIASAKDGSVNLTISGAETIPNEAFKSCYALGSVTLGEGVKSIGNNAFEDARYMTSLIIGDDVTDIGEYAFSACYELVNVTIGKTVENIGKSAFGNTAIESIVIPDSVKTLGTYTFGYCRSLTEIVLSKNIATIPTNAFYGTAIKSLIIPDGVTTLDNLAFQSCTKLESIVIPDSVTSIGDELFSGDMALKSIVFGKGITELTGNLFYYCSSLTEITFLSPITEVASNALYDENAYVPEFNLATANVTLHFDKEQKALEQNEDGIWVATGAYISDENEFCGSTFKKIVVAPMEIDALKMSADDLQAKISELVAAGMTNISVKLAANADADFAAIKNGIASAKDGSVNLTISGAETIPESAFEECMQIKSLTLGEGVKAIGQKAFAVSSLVSVNIGADVESIGAFAFALTAITEINIPDTVTTIEEYAFYYCVSLASVTLSKGISTIPYGTFMMCTSLESITIPSNIMTVDILAFAGSGLTSVVLPDTVTSLGAAAFSGCKALSSVTIGSGIKSIEKQTFDDCEALKSITIPSTVESINERAFSGTGLTSVTVPDSVTSLGEFAFGTCESLTSITIGKGVTNMSKNVFNSNTALTEITFRGLLTEADNLIFHKLTTANVTLTLAQGQKVLSGGDNDNPWTVTSDDFTSGTEFCGCTFNEIAFFVEIDASEMSDEILGSKVQSAIDAGIMNIKINLAADAGSGSFKAIVAGLENAKNGSVDLTIDGANIPDKAFGDCKKLKKITFGDGVKSIGNQSFTFCSYLTTLNLGNGVNKIDFAAFNACSSLVTIIFGDNLETICESAFQSSGLTNVSIPDSVTSLGHGSFGSCANLESVVCGKGITQFEGNPFQESNAIISLTFKSPLTSANFKNQSTENITLTLAKGQKVLTIFTGMSWIVPSETDVVAGENATFCGYTFKEIIIEE